jgi:hypothetical protein
MGSKGEHKYVGIKLLSGRTLPFEVLPTAGKAAAEVQEMVKVRWPCTTRDWCCILKDGISRAANVVGHARVHVSRYPPPEAG